MEEIYPEEWTYALVMRKKEDPSIFIESEMSESLGYETFLKCGEEFHRQVEEGLKAASEQE